MGDVLRLPDEGHCAVEGCIEASAETIRVTARASVWQPNEYVLQEVELDVPLCTGHHDLLTHDALRGLSVG